MKTMFFLKTVFCRSVYFKIICFSAGHAVAKRLMPFGVKTILYTGTREKEEGLIVLFVFVEQYFSCPSFSDSQKILQRREDVMDLQKVKVFTKFLFPET